MSTPPWTKVGQSLKLLKTEQVDLLYFQSLGNHDVATVAIGVHDVNQVRKNVRMVKDFRPLSAEEQTLLDEVGRELAKKWGPRFGPVGEKSDGV